MECYVFAAEQSARACIDYINGTPWFPIVGMVNGVPAPDLQKTERWAEAPMKMASGEFAVPRIPEERLDALNVPQATRDQFLAAFGQDIRDLDRDAFPTQNPEDRAGIDGVLPDFF